MLSAETLEGLKRTRGMDDLTLVQLAAIHHDFRQAYHRAVSWYEAAETGDSLLEAAAMATAVTYCRPFMRNVDAQGARFSLSDQVVYDLFEEPLLRRVHCAVRFFRDKSAAHSDHVGRRSQYVPAEFPDVDWYRGTELLLPLWVAPLLAYMADDLTHEVRKTMQAARARMSLAPSTGSGEGIGRELVEIDPTGIRELLNRDATTVPQGLLAAVSQAQALQEPSQP